MELESDMILLKGKDKLIMENQILYYKCCLNIMGFHMSPKDEELLQNVEYCVANNVPI